MLLALKTLAASKDAAPSLAAVLTLRYDCSIRRNALRSLIPPPRFALSEWIEGGPEGVSALPGAVRLWPYQR